MGGSCVRKKNINNITPCVIYPRKSRSAPLMHVKVTKDENEVINIKDLEEVINIECKEACTLNEVVARYLAKEEVIEETKEEVKPVKKAKK